MSLINHLSKGYILGLVLLAETGWAQTQQEFRLLDLDSALPIEGATYEYGPQHGITDQNGTLTFTLLEGEVMKLSHLSYGSWEWNEEELKRISQQKVYYRQDVYQNLYPVTIVAVRPPDNSNEQVDLDFQDRMEHDAAAILNQVPAMNSIRKSGNYGFDPVFRGFKYDQLNIVLNGAQSATAACPNRMDPPTSQMAPNMLDRIELLKGPHALRFGTGFGATLNFIPSKLRFTEEPDLYGRISGGYESNGNLIRSEGQIGFSGQKYDLSLFAAWSQGDDYRAGNGQTVQADFQRGSFGANLGIKLAPNQQLRLSGLYNRARDADFPALPMDLRRDDTWMFNARHDIQIEKARLKSWNTTLFGSFVDHLMNNLLKPLDPRMLNAETAATTYNLGGRTEGNWQITRNRLYAGADLRLEGANGTRTREFLMGPNTGNTFFDNAWQNGRILKIGLFGEYHLNTDGLQYLFSARLEINHADILDPSDEFTEVFAEPQGTQFNPSFSLGLKKGFGSKITAGLWLGRTQRSGSLTERFINYFPVGQDPFEMLGNPQLKPEVNNQVDLTFSWNTENSGLNVDLFAAYLQNFISSVIDTSLSPRLPMSPGVRQFINIDPAFKTGFEVNWTQKLGIGLQSQFVVAYTYAQDLERDEPLPEIPPLDLRFTLQGSYLKDRLKPEIAFRQVLQQARISTEFGETATPAFSLLDVKVAYAFTEKIRVSAGVNNLLDEDYFEHLNRSVRGSNDPIFAPGRNLFVKVNFAF